MGQHCLLVLLITAIFRKYSRCSKTSNTFHFLFTNKMLAIRTGIDKMHAGIANGEDPECQIHSPILRCLSRPFCSQLVLETLENVRSLFY